MAGFDHASSPDIDKDWRNKFLVARWNKGSPRSEWGFSMEWADAPKEAKEPTLLNKEEMANV